MSMLVNPYASGGAPPTDPFFASVVFLAHMETSSFVDVLGHTRSTTGSPQCVTGETGFGNCVDFGPSGTNYLQYANAGSDLDLGTGDYTIEFRIYIVTGSVQVYFDLSGGSPGVNAPIIYCNGSVWDFFSNGVDARIVSNTVVQTGLWQAFAICRESGVTSMYVAGGKQTGTDSTSTSFSGAKLTLGAESDAAGPSTVQMDEVRITKGVARYSANYTPATAPFPDF